MSEPHAARSAGHTVPEDLAGLRRLGGRVARQLRWAGQVGIARLVEEDRLDPRERLVSATRRLGWMLTTRVERGAAMPVYVVGMQRSGTNMLMRGFQSLPEAAVYNESSRRAFQGYRLRSEQRIAEIVRHARSRYVIFKPLCDSHDTDKLLDTLPVRTRGRALWVYRDFEGRARSALGKFGDVNLRVLREIAGGAGGQRWQAQRLSEASLELIRRFDYSDMNAETAAALFWYVRNVLFFELGLDRREDTMLCSYSAMVGDPETQAHAICGFLDMRLRPDLLGHSDLRSAGGHRPLPVDPLVRRLCDELTVRLDAHAAAQAVRG